MKGYIRWQEEESWPGAVPQLEIDPERTALIIVDMQKYGFASTPNEQDKAIVANCARLQGFFRQHGLDAICVLLGSFLPDRRDMTRKRAVAWRRSSADAPPTPVYPGMTAHEVLNQLAPLPGELVINKNTTGAFNSSPLDGFLKSLEIQNLVVCGTSTANCVATTARGAADRGYNVILVDDACKGSSERNHRSTMSTFSRYLGAVKQTEQVVTELGSLLVHEPLTV